MLTDRNYNLQLPPTPPNGSSLSVRFGIYIIEVGDIDELRMEFGIGVYIRHVWLDPRLEFRGTEIEREVDSLILPDYYFLDKIWLPDTYIENAKLETFHEVTKPNWSFRVYSNGTVFFSQRVSLTLWCFLDLVRFPMDGQTCQVLFKTYRYVIEEVRVYWMENKPIEKNQFELARFELTSIENQDCTQEYSTGVFSCLSATMTFSRLFGYYWIQIYIPSILIVVLSWVSFWLDPLAVPGRISLGVLTILTMSTQMATAATSSLPKVSYVKAIDVWLTTCMCFLFSALIEFAVVNSLVRRELHLKVKNHRFLPPINTENSPALKLVVQRMLSASNRDGTASPNGVGSSVPVANGDPVMDENTANMAKNDSKKWQFQGVYIDIASRVIYPVLFSLFNAIYWSYYLTKS